MSAKYQPQEFEKKWIEHWDKNKTNKTINPDKNRQKEYILAMFPYPSGAGLHVGHVRVYTGTDVLARYFRMNGRAVMNPMGWDAFGLPAENAAIKAKKNPMDMVPEHIVNFKKQMKMLGFSNDWDKELATTDPNYYKWTQWLFIQFYKMGLLYKKNTPINFCPVCKTGLAEEEVLPNGTHERCGNKIEKRELPQWIFKITDYADRLLADLDRLDWPKGILEMQRNWIGRKEGMNITYDVVDNKDVRYRVSHSSGSPSHFVADIPSRSKRISSLPIIDKITCFTTRPDTNFGATFIVLAPEHPFVASLLNSKIKIQKSKWGEIKQYVEKAKAKTEMEREAESRKKTGVSTGFYAVNNLTGKLMPVWVSDFVLMGFGTGAVVGVPGHDMRDFEFAREFGLEIIRVVVGRDGDKSPITKKEQIQEKEGSMINSEFLNGLDIHEATKKIMDYLEEKGWGKRQVTYHLRDWIFSRQRYWGEPIPMIFCEKCAKNQVQSSKFKVQNGMAGWYPVPEDQLPVKLPYVKSYEPTGTGESPLSAIKDWMNTTCPKCGAPAKRETDTMPNWAGSCWYFIAFAFWGENSNSETERIAFASLPPSIGNWKLKIENSGNRWLPVDWYLGGAEHAVLHLLYSRFWVKALYDLKLLDFKEPFARLRNLGMIIAADHRKMSKSFGNVINPDDVAAEFGVDALRIYEMFMAPFSQEIAWSDTALQGSYRFIKRVWAMYQQYGTIARSEATKQNDNLVVKLNKTIAKVTADIPLTKFNTAVAAMMEFLNEWENNYLSDDNAKKFLQILAPFAPFTTEEIWHEIFGEKESIHLSAWPKAKETTVVEEEITIPVQVNGKVRAVIKIQNSKFKIQSDVEKQAIQDEKVKKYVEGKKYKAIYVPGKILNFVLTS